LGGGILDGFPRTIVWSRRAVGRVGGGGNAVRDGGGVGLGVSTNSRVIVRQTLTARDRAVEVGSTCGRRCVRAQTPNVAHAHRAGGLVVELARLKTLANQRLSTLRCASGQRVRSVQFAGVQVIVPVGILIEGLGLGSALITVGRVAVAGDSVAFALVPDPTRWGMKASSDSCIPFGDCGVAQRI